MGGGQLSGCSGGNDPIAYFGIHGTTDGTLNVAGGRGLRDQFVKNNGCQATSAPEPARSGTHIKTNFAGCRDWAGTHPFLVPPTRFRKAVCSTVKLLNCRLVMENFTCLSFGLLESNKEAYHLEARFVNRTKRAAVTIHRLLHWPSRDCTPA